MKIYDDELGEIVLVANTRAKRIIVRRKDDRFYLTHPVSVDERYIRKAIDEMRSRILSLKERQRDRLYFYPGLKLETYTFSVNIFESKTTSNYYVNLQNGILSISCPALTDFTDLEVQKKIRDFIELALRREATRILPNMVERYASLNGFQVTDVKINKSKTRWGSCSSMKRINLSYYCLLLPEHLIKLVVLHELCHTIEMNHGERFWLLLDKVTDGKSKEYTKELNSFKVPL